MILSQTQARIILVLHPATELRRLLDSGMNTLRLRLPTCDFAVAAMGASIVNAYGRNASNFWTLHSAHITIRLYALSCA